ncbi:FAD:protein FMN transferase [Acholeplasma granularum]|uniref:FAD:protein FMN transferase n=1 Tax=Acholeplasma granularum TaxID=264635 RepID=UPI0004ADDF62|nr:FAD:protein FMN transferase [Acholeplasma granularum]
MKKIFLIINLIFLSVLFSACDVVDKNPNDEVLKRQDVAISAMHTFIGGRIFTEDSKWLNIFNELKEMFQTYHELTDNFQGYDNVVGVYYINNLVETTKEDQIVEIKKELYDLLQLGLEITNLTNGYFNMSMGKIIDVWKDLMEEYDVGEVVSQSAIDQTIVKANAIEIIEDAILLSTNNNKYYVTLKYGAKIDLGAIAKGYVTQKAVDYIKDKGYIQYLINSGQSSIAYGQDNYRSKDGTFSFGLINPMDYVLNSNIIGYEAKNYAIYKGINGVLTTSGSYLQYIESDEVWYHHIISPVTKKPENYYMTLTVIGSDAGYMDALSTAMFSMPPGELEIFLNENKVETYTYLFNNTFKTYNQSSGFEVLS